MKIKAINYSKSIETLYWYGLKKWDKAGVEIELNDKNDNPENAFEMAKQLVNEQLYKEISEQEEMRGTKVKDVETEPQDKVKGMMEVISMCKNVQALERFLPSIEKKNNPQLTKVYNDKLAQLREEG